MEDLTKEQREEQERLEAEKAKKEAEEKAKKEAEDKAKAEAEEEAKRKREGEKTFTQEELNEIIQTRLGKERSRMMKKLGIEDEEQLEEIVKKTSEYETIRSENEALKESIESAKKTDILRKLNVDDDFLDYAKTKVPSGENLEDFEKNAKEFIEKNPKMTKEVYQNVDSGLGLGGQPSYPDFTQMTTEQYLAWRAKNKL